MIKVNGIAGVFLYANDPKTLAEWYTLHFGLDFLSDSANTYYMEFYYRDDTDTSKRWSTFILEESSPDPLKSRMMAAIQEVRGYLAGSPILKAITWSYTSHSRWVTLTHLRTLLYNYNGSRLNRR